MKIPRTNSVILGIAAAASILLASSAVMAETFEGTLTDAATGIPVEGASVRVMGTNLEVTTDAQGRYVFDLPKGKYELEIVANVGGEVQRSRMVNQYVPQFKVSKAHVFTSYFMDMGVPRVPGSPGLPSTSGKLPSDAPDSIQLPTPNPAALTVTEPIPRRIRVGRRQNPENGCSNNPVIAIEEMDIDEYVKGVLPPEIGVFRSIPGAAEVYKEFGIAAKSYGLWFMFTYDASNRRNTSALPPNNYTWFHIDDTACNQRYSDQRLDITTNAANAIANKILVKKGEPNTLDKLEYAASCGKHGTLPEYGSKDALVPDNPSVSSCVGSWCGHNSCAAHEDNPHVPGSDRCLVRGICQWGSASWGETGKDYLWMLDHYQPNLEIRDLVDDTEPPAMEVELKGYLYTDADDVVGSALPGLTVTLSNGATTTSNESGVFSFMMVPLALGTVSLSVNAPGYELATRDKELIAGEANWASMQLVPTGSMPANNNTPTNNNTPDPGNNNTPPNNNTPANNNTPDPGNNGNTTPPVDMGGTGNTTPGSPTGQAELGPLVTESPGIDGGCAQSPSPKAPAGALLVGLFGILAFWRRRSRM